MTGAVPGGSGDRLPGDRHDSPRGDRLDGENPVTKESTEGAEWDAALDEALDQFDRANESPAESGSPAGSVETPGVNGAPESSAERLHSRQRLRSALTTMTGRMMSERAVRASEAAAAAAAASAEAATAVASGQNELRERQPRSAFHWGFFGGLGVLIAYVSYLMLDTIRDTLILIAIATLLAIGLDPLVGLITKRGMKRGAGVAVVFLGLLVVIGAAIYAIIPPIVNEVGSFASSVPTLVTDLQNNESIRELDQKFGILDAIQNSNIVQTLGSGAASGLLTASFTVASVLVDLLIVLILTLYLLSGFPKIKAAAFRLVPASRRTRVTDLGERVLKQMGGYLSGATIIAIQAGLVAGIFAAIVGLPYPWAIGLAAAVLDFIPVVGPIMVGVGMTLIGLTQGLAIGIIAGVFYLCQHLFEAYWLYPRVMRRTVDISTGAVVVAIVIGAALLGVTGAILAVPVAAAIMLIVREVIMPMQERS
jgi:predicted PurR-regulated permease PerM